MNEARMIREHDVVRVISDDKSAVCASVTNANTC
jgi:hypothetical protein